MKTLDEITQCDTYSIAATNTTYDIDLGGNAAVGIILNAMGTGINVRMRPGSSSATPVPVYSNASGTPTAIAVTTQSAYIPLDPQAMCGVRYLQIQLQAAQSGAVTFTLATRPV